MLDEIMAVWNSAEITEGDSPYSKEDLGFISPHDKENLACMLESTYPLL